MAAMPFLCNGIFLIQCNLPRVLFDVSFILTISPQHRIFLPSHLHCLSPSLHQNISPNWLTLIFLNCICDVIQVEQKCYACLQKWYTCILLPTIYNHTVNIKAFRTLPFPAMISLLVFHVIDHFVMQNYFNFKIMEQLMWANVSLIF